MNRGNARNAQQPVVPFTIHQVSSEDPDYPARELLTSSSNPRGWQTQRYAQFPQTLIVRFFRRVTLQSLQYLSHQCKIASKVEVYIALAGQEGADPSFRKLGYFTLSTNEANSFQSRELKTVYIEAPVQFVKFIFHQPYANSINFFNQVGVISLKFFGSEIGGGREGGQAPAPALVATEPPRGRPRPTPEEGSGRPPTDHRTQELIDRLEAEKRLAAENEDYAKAKELKEKIQRLKDSGELLARLEAQKRHLVENEDYEGAEVVKREIERLIADRNGGGPAPRSRDNGPSNLEYQRHDSDGVGRDFDRPVGGNRGGQPVAPEPPRQPRRADPPVNSQGGRNFDDQPLPTVNKEKTAKTVMDEYPPEQSEGAGSGEVSKKRLQDLELLLPYFTRQYLSEAFSASIQPRITASERLANEIDLLLQNPSKPGAQIFSTPDPQEAALGAWKLVVIFLEERATQIFQNSCRVVVDLLDLANNPKVSQALKFADGFGQVIDSLFEALQDRVGEFKSGEILDWCTNTLTGLVISNLVPSEEVVERLIGAKSSKGRAVASFKHITGRLMILQNFVREFGTELRQGIQKVVKYCVDNLENANKSVRDEAANLVLVVFRLAGEDRTLKLLDASKAKKGQIEALMHRFEEEGDEAGAMGESRDVRPPPRGNQPPPRPEEDRYDQPSDHDSANAQSEEATHCHFCQIFDENFANQDNMDLHLYKHCMMLMTCEGCHQVVEVKEITNHLLSECKNSANYTQCTRCLKAIPNDQMPAHTARITCKMMRPDQKMARCPLCQADLVTKKNDPDETLRDHLVNNQCPNHPRGE